ncbi:MAG: Stp1/IreP family PP2C-type Ser/Thr phosphatase [Akkermansiaceae bacterium]|nr:Stp1/IreP family PP2C-type Ser/Thr phosphatase [Armatimonadota bacterium]
METVSKDDIQSGQESTAELDGGALQRGWDTIAGTQTPRKKIIATWAARTDIGRVRENNEDKFDFFAPDDPAILAPRGRLWAVADGMGGHSAGQVASEAALKTLVRSYFNPSDTDAEAALKTAFADANALIFRAAQRMGGQNGMGTTLVALVAIEDRFLVAHVGDSRIYRYRGGGRKNADTSQLTQLTTDHSWVEEQVSRKSLTREQAEASPYRNMITRSVGVEENVVPDITIHAAEPGDVYLLCSDGLSGFLDDEILHQNMDKTSNPSRLVLDLIDAANDAGGKDNITALVLRVDAVTDSP